MLKHYSQFKHQLKSSINSLLVYQDELMPLSTALLFFSSSFFFKNRGTFALQCSVSIYCTTMWINYMYTSIPSLMSLRPSHPIPILITEHRAELPVLYSSFPLSVLHVVVDGCGEGNGTHSNTPAWKIPWTEEPGGLQSMGSQRVGHDWATSLSFFTFMHWRRKWQPTPVFLPGESQGCGSLVGCHLWGHTESDTTEVT